MKIRAVILRILRQFLHDKRTIALMMFAPLLILWLVSLIFNGSVSEPKIGLVSVPAPFSTTISSAGANVSEYTVKSDAIKDLSNEKLDAVIAFQGGALDLTLEGSNPNQSKSIMMLLQKATASLDTSKVTPLSELGHLKAPVIHYLYGSSTMTSFDNFGPVLIGVFTFFFVFVVAGIAFLKERTSGTLERLMATPLKRFQIVAGYVMGFGFFTTIQACLIAWFAVDVLGMMMNGRIIYLLIVTFLLSMTALTLGTFLSAFANSEFQLIQFIPIVIVPQIFFSGLFPIDNMAGWMRGLSKVTPLYYGADALRNVMIRGKGFSDIALDLAVLLGLSVCFMTANVIALRKYRKI